MYITIDFEQTPTGFEDAMEESSFRRRLLSGESVGEFNAPDVSALTGNESATIYRLRAVDESRVCLILYDGQNFANRYVQLKIRPYGRLGKAFKMSMDANPMEDQYITFRHQAEYDDEAGEDRITNIFNLDYTPVQYGPHNTKLI
jgi:hypothetical protein